MSQCLATEYQFIADLLAPGSELYSRKLLDGYLARALSVPLENGRLTPVDDSAYVLTLDYTIKMLNINERYRHAQPTVSMG